MHLTQATTWKKRTPDAYTKHREAMQAPQRQTAARNKTLAGLTILLSSPEGTHLQSQWQNPHLAAPHPTPCVNSARCLSSDTLQSKKKGSNYAGHRGVAFPRDTQDKCWIKQVAWVICCAEGSRNRILIWKGLHSAFS